MKYLFFFFFSVNIYAQNIVSGSIISENGFVLQNVTIINISSGAKTSNNGEGFFKIKANTNDELRFVKDNFERRLIIIQNKDFLTSLSIQLIAVPAEIEEVKIAVKLTGDLEKDSKKFNPSRKIISLNKEMAEYVKKPMTEVISKNNIPSSFAPRNLYEGQLNLLRVNISMGGSPLELNGLFLNEWIKKNKRKPDFSEIQNFHRKVKNSFFGDYYIAQGLNEFDFDGYIIYLDNKYKFSESYFSNFDALEIEKILKNKLREFIKNK